MNLFEWFLKKNNPNPTGDFKDREPPQKGGPINWVVLVIGQCIFWFLLHYITQSHRFYDTGFKENGLIIAFFITYIVLGHKIDVEPNYDNMGWFGIFDNPFRYTDDVNRWLVFFKVFLYPGYLMGESFVQLWKLVSKKG